MNRRLRKKLHRGEFNTLGFEVHATFEPPLRDEVAFADSFIAFIEQEDLTVGGGIGNTVDVFVTRVRRGRRIGADRYRWGYESCTGLDRTIVLDWLLARGVKHVVVSPLKGAWS